MLETEEHHKARMEAKNNTKICECGHEEKHHIVMDDDNRYDGRCQARKGNKYVFNAMCGCKKFKPKTSANDEEKTLKEKKKEDYNIDNATMCEWWEGEDIAHHIKKLKEELCEMEFIDEETDFEFLCGKSGNLCPTCEKIDKIMGVWE